MHGDLWKLDAVAQAALVRSREVTPVELLEAAIARIELLNPQINAVITPLYERAQERADDVDRDAPFAGVPMLLKDACQQIEGHRTTAGRACLGTWGTGRRGRRSWRVGSSRRGSACPVRRTCR